MTLDALSQELTHACARLAALEERMSRYDALRTEVMRDTIAELRARLAQAEAALVASRGETRYYRETLARESGLAE